MPESDRRPLAIRSYNQVSGFLGLDKPLDFDKLVRKARRNTGKQHFGTDFNDDALQRLIHSANREARLHPFGRLMFREKLISQLENRLWAEHWFSKYPEILDQEVLPILMVTGLQRTGTTRMQRKLSGQRGARGLLTWEALYPAPLGRAGERDRRMTRTKRNEKAVKWISPTFHAIHPIHYDQPEEDILLLDLHFMSSSNEAILHVPSFASWLNGQDQAEAYAYERKLLLLLQWQRGGRYWVLKTPHHMEYLAEFTRVFPDTRILWMHRPLSVCIPSFLSMLYHSRALFSDDVRMEEIRMHWISKLGQMIRSGMEFRSNPQVPVIDILYEKIVQNENEVISDIAKKTGLFDFTPPSPGRANKRKGYQSRHKYELNGWDPVESGMNGQFQAYQELLQDLVKENQENG